MSILQGFTELIQIIKSSRYSKRKVKTMRRYTQYLELLTRTSTIENVGKSVNSGIKNM